MRDSSVSVPGFLFLSFFRPFVITPVLIFSLMAGNAYGPIDGTLLAALGATISTLSFYLFGKVIGRKIVNPWLSANLPQTLRFLRSQDFKLIILFRMVPLAPFDLFSFLFGLFDFRVKMVFVATFVGYLPQAYILTQLADPDVSFSAMMSSMFQILVVLYILPVLIFEYRSRRRGRSIFRRLGAMWQEIRREIVVNNQIRRHFVHDPKKTPVLLLYGFFSSRRALVILERMLKKKGYEVISFNLGGILGVFFTRGVVDSAHFIDYKIKRQIDRHKLEKIHIVAHSKGGLVALWYLLKCGGSKYCDKLVTMGSPFGGSIWTWAALVTPIGLLFRDVWEMRPGSELIREIDEARIPSNLHIYNLYSNRDWIAHGRKGILQEGRYNPQITPIPMHSITHFQFLSSKEAVETISEIIGPPENEASSSAA